MFNQYIADPDRTNKKKIKVADEGHLPYRLDLLWLVALPPKVQLPLSAAHPPREGPSFEHRPLTERSRNHHWN